MSGALPSCLVTPLPAEPPPAEAFAHVRQSEGVCIRAWQRHSLHVQSHHQLRPPSTDGTCLQPGGCVSDALPSRTGTCCTNALCLANPHPRGCVVNADFHMQRAIVVVPREGLVHHDAANIRWRSPVVPHPVLTVTIHARPKAINRCLVSPGW